MSNHTFQVADALTALHDCGHGMFECSVLFGTTRFVIMIRADGRQAAEHSLHAHSAWYISVFDILAGLSQSHRSLPLDALWFAFRPDLPRQFPADWEPAEILQNATCVSNDDQMGVCLCFPRQSSRLALVGGYALWFTAEGMLEDITPSY